MTTRTTAPSTRRPGRVTFARPGGMTSPVQWSAPELSALTAWSALQRTYAREAAGELTDHVKLIVNGEFVLDPARWPRTPDGSGSVAWLDRQREIGPNADVFVFARAVQAQDPALFRALLEMLAPVQQSLGVPSGHVEAEVFFGRYRATPGGIHREGCANLHLVLDGRKSMYFWTGVEWIPEGTPLRDDVEPEEGIPEEYLPSLEVPDVESRGHVVTAGTGEGFFWRSGVWHVGRIHEPGVACNIASYTRSLDPEAGYLAPWGDRLHGEVPAAWLADYRQHIGSAADDRDLLGRLSALGMQPARPAPSAPPDPSGPTRVRCTTSAPVVWSRSSGNLLVAALGSVAEVPADAATEVARWLEEAVAAPGAESEVPPAARDLARRLCMENVLDDARSDVPDALEA